jgi:hypothetical protein
MKRFDLKQLFFLLLLPLIWGCHSKTSKSSEWTELFNGQDLKGWIPKITGYPTGENYGNTFRVVDSAITVSYDKYERFSNRFGHLFYEKPFSNYVLRIQYRFIGEQAPGGERWATKNSGVMFHSQSPESMAEQQDFPISLEAQFLGGLGEGLRPTGNLCTPGTHVYMKGELITQHCITANAPTYEGEEWVTMDIVARADGRIAHVINGDTLIRYENPMMGGDMANNLTEGIMQENEALNGGYIALQSESHPIQFKKVLIKSLDD